MSHLGKSISLLFCMLVGVASPLHANTNLRVDSFEVYIGDVNGDGVDDVYLRAKDKILLIAGDISIPIIYQDSDSVYISGYDGTVHPVTNSPNLSQFTAGNYTLYQGDFDGNGLVDFLARSNSPSHEHFIIYGNSGDAPQTAQVFSALEGQDITYATLTIKDINNDGKDDIVISTGSGNTVNAVAQSNGQFSTGEQPNSGQVVAGATAGSFNVGGDGSANYSIPIAVPVGGAGMQPKLAFSYSSSSGNGVMGIGWNLSASSSIARCGKNIEQDGVVQGVTLTSKDLFCFGGQRLIAVSGSYAGNGTEYRTEQDSFARIKSYGSGLYGGPSYFTVEYKSGEKAYFGDYSNSPSALENSTGTFHITKIEDRFSSARTYTYEENLSTGEHYLKRIDYPGGAVDFNYYYSRSDNVEGWILGKKTAINRLLKNVISSSAGQTYRSYELGYETESNTNNSRVVTLKECGSDGACLNPTTFGWTSGDTGFKRKNHTSVDWGEQKKVHIIDIDGNGVNDIVQAESTGWKVNLGEINRRFTTIQSSIDVTNSERSLVLDIDSDGDTEILIAQNNHWNIIDYKNGSVSKTQLSTTSEGWQYNPIVADIDGDGRADLMLAYNNQRYVRFNTGGAFGPLVPLGIDSRSWAESQVIDMEGDGKTELLVPYGGFWHLIRYNGSSFSWETLSGVTNEGWESPHIADVNGDGLSDLILPYGDLWHIRINNGVTFLPTIPTGQSNVGWETAAAFDYNDDGKADLVFKRGNFIHTLRSSGNGFELVKSDEFVSGERLYFGDMYGDGFIDVLFVSVGFNTGTKWGIYEQHGTLTNYLTSVTNGFGAGTQFSYNLLSKLWVNKPVVQKGYPLMPVIGPLAVVTTSRLIGEDAKSLTYSYSDLQMHVRGLGSLGFGEMTTVQSDKTKIVNTFSHDWQNHKQGSLEQTEVYALQGLFDGQGKKVSEVTSQYGTSYRAGSSNKVWNTYLYSTVEKAYRLDGTTLITTKTTDYSPDVASYSAYPSDAVGNMKNVDVTVTDKSGNSYYTNTVSRYDQDNLNSWILGRVTSATVTSGGTGRAAVVKKSSWDYKGDGLINSETIEPNNSNLSLTTSYTYNSFGLKQTVTTSGGGVTPRSSTTYYDSYGRYPTKVLNGKGEKVTGISYHPVLGLKTSVTGISGLTAYFSYDGFGRKTTASAPSGKSSSTQFVFDNSGTVRSHIFAEGFGGQYNISLTASYYAEVKDQNGLWQRTYFDKRGRVLEVHKLNLKSQIIVVRTEYDHKGNIYRVSEPFVNGTANLQWTTTVRDDLDRPTSITSPGGYLSTYAYEGLTSTITNAKGHSKIERHTADGKLREVQDNNGNIVRYSYDGAGNMVSMTDAGSSLTTSITYDNRGRKTSMYDPDKGYWSYDYNAFGQLLMQTDAENNKTCMAYDVLGRMVKRIDGYSSSAGNAQNDCAGDASNPNISSWVYDTAANGKGKLHQVFGPNGYSETYEYDSLSRVTKVTKVIAGQAFVSSTDYDNQSRPSTVTYPSGLQTINHYNSLGALTEIRKADNASYYWKLVDVDVRGNVTEAKLGAGVITTNKTYTPDRGFVESIVSSSFGNSGNLQFNYAEYDALGNISLRRDDLQASVETALYDSLNRLEYLNATINDVAQLQQKMTYFANGNIKTKWDVSGSYEYGETECGVTAGPHAVTTANGSSYCYDLNGNMLSGAGRTIDWTTFGKPSRFIKGSTTVDFEYGPNRSRIQRVDTINGDKTTTTYVGGYEKVQKHTGVTEQRHYIGGIAVVTEIDDGSSTTTTENYMLKDNLGSVVAYVDVAKLSISPGSAVERTSFDPWGKRRAKDWTSISMSDLYSYKSAVSDRGFTGHEQIDAVGLVHMNGRVYDPVLGRFISADPIIQDPTDLQSLNRYTYVRNNPLTLTDPSGFSWWGKKGKKLFKNIGLAVVTGGYSLQAQAAGKGLREFGRFARKNKYVANVVQVGGCIAFAPACPVITAGVTYGVTDGDFQAAAKAGAIAFVQVGVSQTFLSPLTSYTAVAGHAVLGGAVSVAQGGKFGHGALSAGLAKGFAIGMDAGGYNALGLDGLGKGGSSQIAARTTMAAIVGGTASQLSGGTFANGAVTAAMQHLFNAEDGGKDKSISNGKKALKALKNFFGVGSPGSITLGVSGKLGSTTLGIGSKVLNTDVANDVATVVLRFRIDNAYEQNQIELDTYIQLRQDLSSDPSRVVESLKNINGRREDEYIE